MVKNKSDIKVGDDDINLAGFFKEIRERRVWFIAAMIIAIASAFIYIRFTLPVYEASSTVLIEETQKPTVNMEDFLAGDLFGDQANIATENVSKRSNASSYSLPIGLTVPRITATALRAMRTNMKNWM